MEVVGREYMCVGSEGTNYRGFEGMLPRKIEKT